MVLNIISVILQYCLIALVYYFLFMIIKAIYRDLASSKHNIELTKTIHTESQPLDVSKSRLVVIDSKHIALQSNSFNLDETTSIGRGGTNDIVIDDKFVSYEHACITYYKNGHWLSDLNSTNHTYLNGKAIAGEILLKDGDVLKIGAVTFKYVR
ncbi:MAG: FHA domain-containing protein [Veillonellaceae bacterium]|jgi:pSer/pThr/pTyr-binding forkhead associated (FHA) protein|nr:FHA domain-containing protein [Veillonellaceae bacterium]